MNESTTAPNSSPVAAHFDLNPEQSEALETFESVHERTAFVAISRRTGRPKGVAKPAQVKAAIKRIQKQR